MVGAASESVNHAEGPVEESRSLADCATHGQILASDRVCELLAGSDLRFGPGNAGVRVVLDPGT
jgi:hypothetical protein